MRSSTKLPLAGLFAAPVARVRQRAAVEPLASFSEPAISPDGRELAVVSGGDIWTVPRAGGEAHLLVSHEANESRPLDSASGDRLAFVSDRTGGGDISRSQHLARRRPTRIADRRNRSGRVTARRAKWRHRVSERCLHDGSVELEARPPERPRRGAGGGAHEG